MGHFEFNLRRESIEMNLHFFSLLLLLVLAVNGAPKPDPKAIPKAQMQSLFSGMMKSQPMRMKSQPMTIVFPGGQIRGNGMVIDNYGNDYSGNSGFGNYGAAYPGYPGRKKGGSNGNMGFMGCTPWMDCTG